MHIGHLSSLRLVVWLQQKFDAKLYFQFSDDEKFLFKENLELEQAVKLGYDNALDVIALGFDLKKTIAFSNVEYASKIYPIALKVAKKVTLSTAKAVFGFENENNIGEIFYTAMQSAPAFLPSVEAGKNVPVLVPLAIDQDPHFRVTRDVSEKLGFYKPAVLHSKFAPSLTGEAKMNASTPASSIFTTDSDKEIDQKVARAFTGGRDTIDEQKRLGGKPDNCPIFNYYKFLFEDDDKKLEEIRQACLSGKLLCGEDKARLKERIKKFLKEHQEKREKARSKVDKFMQKCK
jgi:tryptophanyl-tRNA synthetase